MSTSTLRLRRGAASTLEKDHICCAYCPFYETYSRKQCRLTGEYLLNEYGRGYYCRLELEDLNETVSDTEAG